MIFNILDNTTELWMTKYIICDFFSSGGATLYKNPSDQSVTSAAKIFLIFFPAFPELANIVKSLNYKCHYCDKEFSNLSGHKKHIRNVHERPFKCNLCENRYESDEDLKNHRKDCFIKKEHDSGISI